MPILERISKTAATSSVVLIGLLLLLFHPDITPGLLALTIAAIVAGAVVPARLRPLLHAGWVVAAMLSPALLRAAASREGPVLDLFWMAGLSASLMRAAPWSEWRLPARWRVLAAGWALTVSLAWPVIVSREIGFDVRGLSDVGAINSWSLLSAPQVASWVLFVAWTQLLALLWLEWACRAFEDAAGRVPAIVHGFWIGPTIASLIAVYQGTVDLEFLSTPFWASRARVTGTLLDANAFGVSAAIAGPLAFLALRDPHALSPRLRTSADALKALVFLVFVVNLAGLWMSGSRTATLCGIVATSVFAVATWSSLNARARRILPWAAAVAVVLVATLVATSNAIGPARRVAAVLTSRTGISTIFIREQYGQIANQMVREHPLTGVGLGTYQILAPDYWRQQANDQLAFDNAQNWWRHQLSEFGVVGSLPLFIWSAVIAWQMLTTRPRPGRRLEATIVRGMVAAFGVGSLIQVPTQTPIVMLAFMTLLAWSGVLLTDATTRGEGASRWPSIAVMVIAFAYAGGHLALAAGPLAVAERARLTQRAYAAGTYPPEVVDGREFRWTKGDATFVWPAKTRWMVLRVWAQHPDLAAQPVHVTLTSQCGVLFDDDLKTAAPVSVGVTVPAGVDALVARLQVSRTWRPSDHGSNDERDLGAAIVAEFVADAALTAEQNRAVTLSSCPGGI